MQHAIDRYNIHKFQIGEGLGSPILQAAAQGKWRKNCKWSRRCGRGHRGENEPAMCDTRDSKKDQHDYCGKCEYGWRRPNLNLNDWCCSVHEAHRYSDCKCQEEYALECPQALSTAGEKSNIYFIVHDEFIIPLHPIAQFFKFQPLYSIKGLQGENGEEGLVGGNGSEAENDPYGMGGGYGTGFDSGAFEMAGATDGGFRYGAVKATDGIGGRYGSGNGGASHGMGGEYSTGLEGGAGGLGRGYGSEFGSGAQGK